MNNQLLARNVCERMFARECSITEKLLSSSDTAAQMFERHLSELNIRWSALQEKHDAYVIEFVTDSVEIAANNLVIERYADEYVRIEAACLQRLKPCQDSSSNPVSSAATNSVKLERVKFRTFDGDVRKFPKFKSEFKTFVEPLCSPSQLCFVLKSYLCDSVRKEVRNIDNDIVAMWKRLDEKYGTVQKQIDCIMYDFKHLPVCQDTATTLHMIDIVETAAADLKCINASSELENHMIISYIEQSMSRQMLEKWAESICHSEDRKIGSAKFSKLIEFLLHWRWLLEYNDADIRKPTDAPLSTIATSCTATSSSTAANRKCLVHSDSHHPVWRCRKFQSMTVKERYDIVKLNNACMLCLDIGHNSSSCRMNFRCTAPQCGATHHVLLHDHFTASTCDAS